MRKERQKWLVLVVEDDETLQNLIVRVLEKGDFEVMVASNGAEGLALASAKPKPHLIISDIMMPDMDGLDMVKRIKRDPQTKPIPVIFLTARDTPKDVIHGINAGARHYMTKPFRVPELLEKVRTILPELPD